MIELVTDVNALETGVDYRFHFAKQPLGGEFDFELVARFQAVVDDRIVLLKSNGLGAEVAVNRFLKAEVIEGPPLTP